MNQQESSTQNDVSGITIDLTFAEVCDAIDNAKNGKAFLDVPNSAKILLHKFFSICFQYGLSPFDWDYSNIKPVPKKDKDPRIPLNNRPITIMCCVAKIYSTILNKRLQKYLESNNLLAEEQNGCRAARSCIDHIFTLITILRNRKTQNKDTYLAFIDFSKAFDSVDRTLLLFKLSKIGIVGRMYSAISALYRDPKSRVVLNDHPTDWFSCPIGVKQGDTLSPTLFTIFIDDLKHTGVGIVIEDLDNESEDKNKEKEQTLVNSLFYVDDIVCLAESEEDLQLLLNVIYSWCFRWRFEVNILKTNILHIRKKRKKETNFIFKLENKIINNCQK